MGRATDMPGNNPVPNPFEGLVENPPPRPVAAPPAQQAGPPLALEEQVLSGSSEPRRSSRVRQPASTHPDDVYGSMDPISRQQMDLRRGLANLPAEDPA